jgi:predicted AAA+ superfamily ATPase
VLPRTALSTLREIIETYGKMAFVSGPRQVGKTTLAQQYRKQVAQGLYFNWDARPDQKKLLRDPYFFEKENRDPRRSFLVILDEIHKYARWKNYLKGAYDLHHGEFKFLVTGSGRLDLCKKGGDSLLGRYFSLPLFPFTLGELAGKNPTVAEFRRSLGDPPPADSRKTETLTHLLKFTGFPEPFIRGTARFYNVWSEERKTLLIREDIRSTSALREISHLEHLGHLLPERVGNPLSLNSLREDLQVAFESVRDWVRLLEQFFYLFRLRPFAGSLARSLKKEPKIYLYDWGEVPDEGYRFENLIALHLHKAVRTWRARGEGKIDLAYLRDKDKREVDFAILKEGVPFCLVEAKLFDESLAPSLLYFQRKLQVPHAVQVVMKSGVCKKLWDGELTRWVISADQWLSILP